MQMLYFHNISEKIQKLAIMQQKVFTVHHDINYVVGGSVATGYGTGLATRWSRVQFPTAGLILGWVTVFGRVNHLSISPSHPDQLSLLPSAGRELITGIV